MTGGLAIYPESMATMGTSLFGNLSPFMTGGGKKRRKRKRKRTKRTKRKKLSKRRTRRAKGKRTRRCNCKTCKCNPCKCTKRSKRSRRMRGGSGGRVGGEGQETKADEAEQQRNLDAVRKGMGGTPPAPPKRRVAHPPVETKPYEPETRESRNVKSEKILQYFKDQQGQSPKNTAPSSPRGHWVTLPTKMGVDGKLIPATNKWISW